MEVASTAFEKGKKGDAFFGLRQCCMWQLPEAVVELSLAHGHF